MQEFILKNLFTIVFIALLVYGFIKGFASGFLKKILSFGSLIITIIATKVLTPIAANMVKDVTGIESTLTDIVYNALMNSNIYDKLNINWVKSTFDTGNLSASIKDGICNSIANILINLICGIVVFILVLFLVKIILKILDVVDYIPVVGQLNKLLGGVLGVVEMIIITWIVFTILKVLENVPQVSVIVDNIEGSFLVSTVYKNNLVYNFMANLFLIFKK